jgi:hypothetical protein
LHCWCSHANATDEQGQPADKTTRIKSVHLSALLALNPDPINKRNGDEVLPQPVRQKTVALKRTFPITAANTTASPMQVLGMRAHDMLLCHLS